MKVLLLDSNERPAIKISLKWVKSLFIYLFTIYLFIYLFIIIAIVIVCCCCRCCCCSFGVELFEIAQYSPYTSQLFYATKYGGIRDIKPWNHLHVCTVVLWTKIVLEGMFLKGGLQRKRNLRRQANRTVMCCIHWTPECFLNNLFWYKHEQENFHAVARWEVYIQSFLSHMDHSVNPEMLTQFSVQHAWKLQYNSNTWKTAVKW